jgi:hypothetical protein
MNAVKNFLELPNSVLAINESSEIYSYIKSKVNDNIDMDDILIISIVALLDSILDAGYGNVYDLEGEKKYPEYFDEVRELRQMCIDRYENLDIDKYIFEYVYDLEIHNLKIVHPTKIVYNGDETNNIERFL